jgi:hypothetical protein
MSLKKTAQQTAKAAKALTQIGREMRAIASLEHSLGADHYEHQVNALIGRVRAFKHDIANIQSALTLETVPVEETEQQ